MEFMVFLSTFILPFVIFGIIGYGILMGKNVYELFVKGAGDGVHTAMDILPTLVGLLVGAGVLRASGFLEWMADLFGGIMQHAGIHPELIPVILVRLFSASAASGLVMDLFKNFGPDSVVGFTASTLMSCTETVFYTMSIYFVSVKIKKGRYTLAGALTCTAVGVAAAIVLSKMFLGKL